MPKANLRMNPSLKLYWPRDADEALFEYRFHYSSERPLQDAWQIKSVGDGDGAKYGIPAGVTVYGETDDIKPRRQPHQP